MKTPVQYSAYENLGESSEISSSATAFKLQWTQKGWMTFSKAHRYKELSPQAPSTHSLSTSRSQRNQAQSKWMPRPVPQCSARTCRPPSLPPINSSYLSPRGRSSPSQRCYVSVRCTGHCWGPGLPVGGSAPWCGPDTSQASHWAAPAAPRSVPPGCSAHCCGPR